MHVPIPSLAQSPHFAPESRVWVYVSNRLLTDQEAAQTTLELQAFCRQWTAHNQALKATAEIFEKQFVILMVDETQAGASGCSIDKSVHFLEQLGQAIGVDFFERMRFAWVGNEGELQFANRLELADAVKNQTVSDNTLMVNSLVQSKLELAEKWLVPYGKSWHRRI
ncbi:MAG: hypothetical protein JNJ57_19210 [Saprospiraceae bacterium]|nr:hypothetical protein [Saprospiraceae bacterium]